MSWNHHKSMIIPGKIDSCLVQQETACFCEFWRFENCVKLTLTAWTEFIVKSPLKKNWAFVDFAKTWKFRENIDNENSGIAKPRDRFFRQTICCYSDVNEWPKFRENAVGAKAWERKFWIKVKFRDVKAVKIIGSKDSVCDRKKSSKCRPKERKNPCKFKQHINTF